jgi:hypothetical protein
MASKNRFFPVLVAASVLVFFMPVLTASGQMMPGPAPGGGTTTSGTYFSGMGKINAVDPTARTITITMTFGSRLLESFIGGNPANFPISTKAYIAAMPLGGMMGGTGGMMGGNFSTLTLSNLKPGDFIGFMGTYDSTKKQYTLTRIMDWIQ